MQTANEVLTSAGIIEEKVIANCELHGACAEGLNWLREKPRTFVELRSHSLAWWRWLAQHCSHPDVLEKLASNHPEHLDPALLRDGRIDVRLDLKSPTRRQAERLFFRFFPQEHPQYAEAWAEEAIRHKKCMAQLQGELARKVFQPVVLAPPADKEFLYPAYEVRY